MQGAQPGIDQGVAFPAYIPSPGLAFFVFRASLAAMLKKLSLGLVLLLLVLIVSPFVLPWVLDLNRFKDEIAQIASEFSGFDVSIDGELEVTSLLPTTILSVSGVKVSPSGSQELLATVQNFTLIARPLGLLTGDIVVESVSLESPVVTAKVEETGLTNWSSSLSRQDGSGPESSKDAFELPFDELRLTNARLTSGRFSYSNAMTGEAHEAKDIDLLVSLPSWKTPLKGQSKLTLNDVPVFLNFQLDSPAAIAFRRPVKTQAHLESRHISGEINLTISETAEPALDGSIALEIPSAAAFASWLGQELESPDDPGRVALNAKLASEKSATSLKDLRIEGDNWKVMATARFDPSQDPQQISLNVSGDRIDLDRYIPKNRSESAFEDAWEQDWEHERSGRSDDASEGDSSDWLDESIDLAFLRGTDLDLTLDFAGLKAGGFEVGKTTLSAKILDGVLDGYVSDFTLYGGRLLGDVHIDTQGNNISARTRIAIDKINFSEMYRASGIDLGVRGIANGHAQLAAAGTTPRALATALNGSINLDLKGPLDDADAKEVITDTNLTMILPENEESPYVLARTHYAGKRIDLDVESDRLAAILGGSPFALDIDLKSPLLTARYEGKVHQSPAVSLDGSLDVKTPSAGQLASWLGHPLSSDPGPITLTGRFDSDGTKGRIAEARLEGGALNAEISGDFDLSGESKRYRVQAKSEQLDLRPFFPAEDNDTAEDKKTRPARSDSGKYWRPSEAPLDLAFLESLDAEFSFDGDGIVLPQGKIRELGLKATAKDGSGRVVLERAALAEGTLQGQVSLDTTGKTPVLSAKLQAENMLGETLSGLLFEEGPEDPLFKGAMDANLDLKSDGSSEKQLIARLKGNAGTTIASLRLADGTYAEKARLALQFDGPGQDSTARFSSQLRLPDRGTTEPFEGQGTTSSPASLLADETFSFDLKATLSEIKLATKGTVAKPLSNPTPEAHAAISGQRYEILEGLIDAGLTYTGPFSASLSVMPDGDALRISDLAAAMGASSLTGELEVMNGTHPTKVTGRLSAAKIDLVELLGTSDSSIAVGEETKDSLHKSKRPTSKIFPDSELPFDLLDSADTDLQVHIGSLRIDPTLEFTEIDAHILLQSGHLRLDPFSVVLWNGKLTGVMTAANSKPKPNASVKGSLEGVDYGAILSELDITKGLHGLLDVKIDVTGEGASPRALASSLTGTFGWLGKDGQVDRKLLGMFAFGTGDILAPLFGDKNDGTLACSVFAMDFKQGIGTSRIQYYETDVFSMVGEGKINLKKEKINFSYSPSARSTSLMSLAVPFKVTGPLQDPSVSVGTEGTLVGAAKAAGAVISVLNPLIGAGLLALNEVSSRSSGCDKAIAIAKGGERPQEEMKPPAIRTRGQK